MPLLVGIVIKRCSFKGLTSRKRITARKLKITGHAHVIKEHNMLICIRNCWLHKYKQENRNNTANCYSVSRQCKFLHCNAGGVKGIMERNKEPDCSIT